MRKRGVDLHPSAIAKMEEREPKSKDGALRTPRSITLNEAVAAAESLKMRVDQLIIDGDDFGLAYELAMGIQSLSLAFEHAHEAIESLAKERASLWKAATAAVVILDEQAANEGLVNKVLQDCFTSAVNALEDASAAALVHHMKSWADSLDDARWLDGVELNASKVDDHE